MQLASNEYTVVLMLNSPTDRDSLISEITELRSQKISSSEELASLYFKLFLFCRIILIL